MVGTRISHYRLTGRLGKGGMGVVYEAVDEMLGRNVALKLPARETAPSGQLASEARAASRLNHPNVAQIYEYGETAEGTFIAMELVRGRTLREMLRDGPLAPQETVRIVRAVAEALEEAHRQGIMHLDIKPGNIAINDRGVVKVLDFGLAKSLPAVRLEPDDDDPRTKTLTVEWRGTPAYMSPEQARGQPLDARSDLFSLGAVMYECLTGRRAFPAESAVGTLLEVVSSDPPPPSAIARDVPQRLDGVVRKLLAKDREARYGSATELLVQLSDTRAVYTRRSARPRLVAAVCGVALLLLVALVTALWHPWNRTRQVVVLPFDNLSRQPEEAAFCDGLTEVVTGLLSRPGAFSGRLWVVPSADVRRFAVETAADAGRKLHADLAISGSVQRDSEVPAWVITVSASDAPRGRLLGSRTIRLEDRQAGELEAKLTAALVALLDVPAGAASARTQPVPAGYSRFVVAQGYLRQYDRGDNLKRAIAELEAITGSAPDFAAAQVALGEAYYRRYIGTKEVEWLAKADQAIRRGAELNENEPGVHLMLGRILRATGQTDAAIRELRAALAQDPGDVVALLQLAGAYESVKRLPEAEETYRQTTRLRPSYFQAYMNLGVFYMNQGKWQQAEEPLTLVTKLAPDFADGYTNLGTLEYYLGKLSEAQRLYTRSIDLKPTTTAYANRCAVEFDSNAMEAAVADCRKAVDLQPASAIARGNLADALLKRGNEADAMAEYRSALEAGNKLLAINPSNPDLLGSMAKFAAKTDQKELAVELATRAVGPNAGVRVLYNAGKAFGLAGDCARSLELLKEAFDKGYPRQDARRDPDLSRLRAAPLACAVPPI